MILYGKAIMVRTLQELCEKNKRIDELKGALSFMIDENIEETRKFLVQVHYTHGPWRLIGDMVEILDMNDHINKSCSGTIPGRPNWSDILTT